MPITDILEKNCRLYGDDVCLVEINPEMPETRRVTWKEYELIEPVRASYYRREITWNVFCWSAESKRVIKLRSF